MCAIRAISPPSIGTKEHVIVQSILGSYRHLVALSFAGLCAVSGCGNLIGLGEYSVADDSGNAPGGMGNVAGSNTGGSAGAGVGGSSLSGSAGTEMGEGGTGGVPDESAGSPGEGGAPEPGGGTGGIGGTGGSAGGTSGSAGGGGAPATCPSGCDDSNDCTTDSCKAGVCAHDPLPVGTACGGSRSCDAQALCVRCRDTAAGTGQDVGCSPTAPMCLGTGLDAVCAGCSSASDCNDGNECTTETCNAGKCVFSTVAAGTPCATGVCNGTASAEKCLTCTTSSLISTAVDGGNGGFEAVTKEDAPNQANVTADGWLETGGFYIVYQCGSGGCNGTNGATYPQTPLSVGGSAIAWLGNQGVSELYRAVTFPAGTTKVQLLADINFQTQAILTANQDFFEARLLDSSLAQVGAPLYASSNAAGQTGTARAWTKDGINVVRDVPTLSGKAGYLLFWSSVDGTLDTDFFFDNVRLIATVCN
jgi:hypothetical protein